MSANPERVTQPLLDVLEVFWQADEPLHGHRIKKLTKRSGPTVYNNLDRLAKSQWIVGTWQGNPEAGLPARRVYNLTPEGRAEAEKILIRAGRIRVDGLNAAKDQQPWT